VPSLRDIRRRISSIKNTRQITSAMKLVAGAKLRRATANAQAARPYQEALSRVLGRVAGAGASVDQPLLQARPEIHTVAVTIFASDRGLCGGFNNLLFRYAERRIQRHERDGHKVILRTFGRKTRDYFQKRGYEVVRAETGLATAHFADVARDLAVDLRVGFTKGEIDQAELLFNEFRSILTQRPCTRVLLPLTLEAGMEGAVEADYVFEPDATRILDALLPLYVDTMLLQALLETEAGEQAARMRAMDSATRNATELIDKLTLAYNRARQAAITKELIEIVSGAAAS
jgi:F-type H+-transporting ATPase subunit gamma